MKNLLSAEFSRLFKNRLFHGLLISAFLFGTGMQLYIYFGSLKSDIVPRIDSGFFAIAMLIGFVAAAFVSLFVGTEYSDGTLRNKIIHGKLRRDIYLSKFAICGFALLLIYVSYYSASLLFGLPINGKFTSEPSSIIVAALTLYLSSCSYIAVFLAIAMNCNKKAVVSVTSLLLAIALFFTAVAVTSMLNEPEYYPESLYMDENGELRNEPEQPNPNYPTGVKRKVLEIVNDLNPTGQCIQLSGALDESGFVYKTDFLLYAAGLIFISTTVGLIVFKKKDIA